MIFHDDFNLNPIILKMNTKVTNAAAKCTTAKIDIYQALTCNSECTRAKSCPKVNILNDDITALGITASQGKDGLKNPNKYKQEQENVMIITKIKGEING